MMHHMRGLWAAGIGLALALVAGPALAQLECTAVPSGSYNPTLLEQFSDSAAAASITPENVRNVICSLEQLFGTGTAGLAPVSPGGTTQFLRADGTWAVPPGSGGGGGSGTVNSGTTGQLGYYASTGTAISGTPYASISSGTLSLGSIGIVGGQLALAGATNGTVTLAPQPSAGTYSWNYPTSAGASGQVLLSGGGGTNPMSWGAPAIASGGTGATTASGARANLGLGTAAVAAASSGTGTVAAVSGTVTNGDCAQFNDSVGTLVDSGHAGCGTGGGGGSGVVNNGTAGQVAYYASTASAVSGNASLTITNGTVTVGQTGSVLGQLKMAGNTSGAVTIQPQAAAGTYNFNLPTGAGTSGQPLLSGGGSSSPMTYGTLAVANGGTGATSGSAALTNLGCGSVCSQNTGTSGAVVPLLNASNTWGAFQGNAAVAVSFSSTITPTWTAGNLYTLTATGNFTLANPSSLATGCTLWQITQDATGGRVITWGSQYHFSGGTKFVLSTGAGDIDAFTACATSGSYIIVNGLNNFS